MHVVILPSWYPTDPSDINGVFFREQAIALARRNLHVAVLVPPWSLPVDPRRWNDFWRTTYYVKDEGVITYRPRFMNWSRLISRKRTAVIKEACHSFDRYCAAHGKPNILHAHSALPGGEIAMALSQKHHIPFVVTEHFSGFASGAVPSRDLVRAQKVFSSADVLVTVSSAALNTIESSCSATFPRARVIPNILSKRFLASHPSSMPMTDTFTFLNVALLVSIKRQDLLLRAFALAFGRDESVTLRIAGHGSEMKRLQKLARDLGIADRVTFLGMLNRAQVLDEMNQCHAFVLSSELETFGVVVIEALSQGKPVVATRCGGPEDILHAGNGILVRKNDKEALAGGLARMRAYFPNYDSGRIRYDCLKRFSEDAVVTQLGSMYEDVLKYYDAEN
jgi:glycosyltransferase involved in cell wall biosynthesis